MSKVQAKSKSSSSFGDFLNKLGGNEPKAKAPPRGAPSTQANLQAQGQAVRQAASPVRCCWSPCPRG